MGRKKMSENGEELHAWRAERRRRVQGGTSRPAEAPPALPCSGGTLLGLGLASLPIGIGSGLLHKGGKKIK